MILSSALMSFNVLYPPDLLLCIIYFQRGWDIWRKNPVYHNWHWNVWIHSLYNVCKYPALKYMLCNQPEATTICTPLQALHRLRPSISVKCSSFPSVFTVEIGWVRDIPPTQYKYLQYNSLIVTQKWDINCSGTITQRWWFKMLRMK